ncbi:MAG: hypothetical protein ABSH13_00325 [Candidatus Acidiferrum sp.]|jgi:hypothetical protein
MDGDPAMGVVAATVPVVALFRVTIRESQKQGRTKNPVEKDS